MRFLTKHASYCLVLLIAACILLFLGSATDLWTPFEDLLPAALFDSPLDSVLFLHKFDSYRHGHGNLTHVEIFSASNETELCGLPELKGPIKVWLDNPSMAEMQKLYPNLQRGGHGFPEKCRAVARVAVIIPYRGRKDHLHILLHNLHSFLTKQRLDYGIFVVEQADNEIFNKAKLSNIGFVEAQKYYEWDCFIFHDVDLLPQDDRNLYKCSELHPRHLSVAVDKFNYTLPYPTLFGGVVAMTKKQVEDINGYSNSYFGWGGEDDDLVQRLLFAGYRIARYPSSIGRYRMLKHKRDDTNPVNPCRNRLMKRTRRRMGHDGLSSLEYTLISAQMNSLFTHILVDPLVEESRRKLQKENSAFVVC